MTKVAIDQLLQVTAPAPSARTAPKADSTDGQRFSAHLDRATEAATPKDAPEDREPEISQLDDEESLEVADQQQDTATNQQDETTQSTESDSAESVSDEEKESERVTDQEDEVTLSSTAVALEAENPINSKTHVAASGEGSTAATADSNDDQSNPQTTQPAIEVSVEASTQTTPEGIGELELTSSSATVDQEHGNSDASTSEQPTTEVTPVSAAVQSQAVASAATVVANSQNAKESGAARQPKSNSSTTASSQQETGPPIPRENEANQDQRTTNQPNQLSASVFQTNELSGASELELKSVITNTTVESHSGHQPPASPTDTPVGVDKPIGLLGTSRAEASPTTSGNPSAPETPTVDRIRFVQRVSGAIRSAHQRDGQIQLRLSPPELGNLKIQLTVNESAITANLETETSAARTVLLDNLPALRERLADQGITIEKFNVDVGREGQQQADNHGAGERNEQNGSSDNGRRSTESSQTDTAPAESLLRATVRNTETGLDIRI